MESTQHRLLSVEGLKVCFHCRENTATAVNNVSFEVSAAQTLCIVGESGSGKSVTSLAIMGLLQQPTGRIAQGAIRYTDRSGRLHDLATATQQTMQSLRGREISMIFQEPMTSLNPLLTIGDQISEVMITHEGLRLAQAMDRARAMLELVEIPAAARRLNEYPHQMSGGMRQRMMIALALACNPSLLIADEPTTALDVTVQAQILDLLRRLQAERGMAILFITHNMGVVAEIADHVMVMYAGSVVESAPVIELFDNPRHPYTRGLLSCIPDRRKNRDELFPIPGNIPNILRLPPGCAFAPRCAFAEPACQEAMPGPLTLGASHTSFCRRANVL